ncbi:putative Retrovirus-related Pol polyprotein from transposon RE1 [Cocos nucifera]|uniref:Putative Retrovirus-related Pol polyprotein from transposon RE1 n=1 Tax=Cocos nucifera TaxID=13894 RepID=A0A8K0N367_COCNU|nr:putative Retrovirus-related Pol polyprotein from transposon RE1 [Cocos nucifera]
MQPFQLISFNPTSQLSLKLIGSTNYSTWQAQVTTLLFGHNLFSFIDGSSSCPSMHLQDHERQYMNPKYKLWQRQDSLVRNAIMASVDHSIAPLIAHASIAQQA